MADSKTVRGVLAGATVEIPEEKAERLGSAFEPEKSKPPAKKAAAKKSSN